MFFYKCVFNIFLLTAIEEENENMKSAIEEVGSFPLSIFSFLVLVDTKKLILYTGAPTSEGFDWILSISKEYITHSFSIHDEHQLLMVLIKLRMALCDEDIALCFSVSRRAVRRFLHIWLPVLASRVKYLVPWPKIKLNKINWYPLSSILLIKMLYASLIGNRDKNPTEKQEVKCGRNISSI